MFHPMFYRPKQGNPTTFAQELVALPSYNGLPEPGFRQRYRSMASRIARPGEQADFTVESVDMDLRAFNVLAIDFCCLCLFQVVKFW